jgi:23S rRNA (uracil1939-C5)-methyltransferase
VKQRRPREHEVVIDKLIHGGQGIGTLDSGKRALVWGVLPGEKVIFCETKKRSDFIEGIATKVLQASKDRIEPKDELYLSTSPWQIMNYEIENKYKADILLETIQRAGVDYSKKIELEVPNNQWQYRNKMEYSFYGDDDGVHLALFNRGTHRKQIVTGSSLARREIDEVAHKLCEILNQNKVRASDLKSVILRCDYEGKVVVALFTRDENFRRLDALEELCRGVIVVYSNPKSPASVRSKDLYKFGDISLTDTIQSHKISYDVFSFFQVNLDIYNAVINHIKQLVGTSTVVDLYSGVGSIGLSLAGTKYLVEIDAANVEWANQNANRRQGPEVVHASSDKALDYITHKDVIIVDPPRAGLHKHVVNKINEVKPPKVIYLSCNPSTQARDLKLLEESYDIQTITGYNFFPRTPHIESLAVLVRR